MKKILIIKFILFINIMICFNVIKNESYLEFLKLNYPNPFGLKKDNFYILGFGLLSGFLINNIALNKVRNNLMNHREEKLKDMRFNLKESNIKLLNSFKKTFCLTLYKNFLNVSFLVPLFINIYNKKQIIQYRNIFSFLIINFSFDVICDLVLNFGGVSLLENYSRLNRIRFSLFMVFFSYFKFLVINYLFFYFKVRYINDNIFDYIIYSANHTNNLKNDFLIASINIISIILNCKEKAIVNLPKSFDNPKENILQEINNIKKKYLKNSSEKEFLEKYYPKIDEYYPEINNTFNRFVELMEESNKNLKNEKLNINAKIFIFYFYVNIQYNKSIEENKRIIFSLLMYFINNYDNILEFNDIFICIDKKIKTILQELKEGVVYDVDCFYVKEKEDIEKLYNTKNKFQTYFFLYFKLYDILPGNIPHNYCFWLHNKYQDKEVRKKIENINDYDKANKLIDDLCEEYNNKICLLKEIVIDVLSNMEKENFEHFCSKNKKYFDEIFQNYIPCINIDKYNDFQKIYIIIYNIFDINNFFGDDIKNEILITIKDQNSLYKEIKNFKNYIAIK
jgi:hypothetical protein